MRARCSGGTTWHVASKAYFRSGMLRTRCRGGENSGTCSSRVIDSLREISENSEKSLGCDIPWWWWIAQFEVIMLSRAHGVRAQRFHLNRESKTARSESASASERKRGERDLAVFGWTRLSSQNSVLSQCDLGRIKKYSHPRTRRNTYSQSRLLTMQLGYVPSWMMSD